ncbi:murein L,D-transpeptidase YafK [Desulfosalsimonas propionicica]|uniref:Murein L,D-transpeptidase YafK n=1 Tax=Desulfosalsimonas propionicica TaxID=332175 RepID=A0A7W0C8D4_9BACT|nr:L,D-transpeptidase family protein [Desulfosalsimonas propionicica]MBA2880944.1 murein L,D-transpeptidase YafK [Desulfosalsimonas propionicica]
MRIIADVIALVVVFFAMPGAGFGLEKADMVVVVKSESRLYLKCDGQIISEYHVVFGPEPEGHKLQEGDGKTPEGKYVLDYKNANSDFYKSIHISYPNRADRKRAVRSSVDPGGEIMIHGQKNGAGWLASISKYFNWTQGCIAVSNKAMDEIWQAVDAGTPIEIKP